MFTHYKTVKSAKNRFNYGRRLTWVLVAGGCCVMATGCSLLPQQQVPLAPPLVKPAPVQYQTVTVQRGNIINEIDGTASVISTRQVALSYRLPTGRIQEIDVQAGQSVQAGQVLVRLDTSDVDFQLSEALLQLQKDQLKVKQLQAQRADTYQIQMAQLDVQGDQLQTNYLKQQITQSELVSPIDGVVTDITSLRVGDSVTANQPLVTIADTHQLALSFSTLDSQTAGEITQGMTVNLLFPNQHTPATVTRIHQDNTTYATEFWFAPKNPPSTMKMGDSVDFQIVTEKKLNVITVPKSALHQDFGSSYVQVLNGTNVQQINVQTGAQDGSDIEIVHGLKVGQKVVVQ